MSLLDQYMSKTITVHDREKGTFMQRSSKLETSLKTLETYICYIVDYVKQEHFHWVTLLLEYGEY